MINTVLHVEREGCYSINSDILGKYEEAEFYNN